MIMKMQAFHMPKKHHSLHSTVHKKTFKGLFFLENSQTNNIQMHVWNVQQLLPLRLLCLNYKQD